MGGPSSGSAMQRALRRAERESASPEVVEFLEQALTLRGSAVDRHFIYNELIKVSYRLRDLPGMLGTCERACREQIGLLPSYAKKLSAAIGLQDGQLPRIPAYQRLAIILEKRSDIAAAIGVCQQAVLLGLDDGTKAGFAGRIERLSRRLERGESKRTQEPPRPIVRDGQPPTPSTGCLLAAATLGLILVIRSG